MKSFCRGEDMKDINKVFEYLIYVGQLGLDLIMPSLLCLGGAWFLNTRFGWGIWIYFVALFFGLAAGGKTFWRFYKKVVMKDVKKPDLDKPEKVSFSKHI